ncbi:hypothetical protein [Streptomyces xantholiticus]
MAISRGGVMFFADPTAAFANIGRALGQGGRLAFICPQPAGPDAEESRALGLLASLLHAPTPQESTGVDLAAAMASLSDPDRTGKVLGAAGFEDIRITGVQAATCWGQDAADAVDFYVSRHPGAEVTEPARAAMRDALRPYETERGVLLAAGVWVVTARRAG